MASAAAKICGSVPAPAVRKSTNVSSPPSPLAAMAASASPMKLPDRREVAASQRIPCERWASCRKRDELQPILGAVAVGAGIAPDQHADPGGRIGAPEARSRAVAGGSRYAVSIGEGGRATR